MEEKKLKWTRPLLKPVDVLKDMDKEAFLQCGGGDLHISMCTDGSVPDSCGDGGILCP